MDSPRITVWISHFSDRRYLQLQYLDPVTRRKRTVSARTECPRKAEAARVDLEADLNAGRFQEPSRLSWRDFRGRYEAEHVSALRPDTRRNYADALDAFEELCRPTSLRGVTEAAVSRFAAALRGRGNAPSTVRCRLRDLKTALRWAAGQKLIPAVPAFPRVRVPRTRPRPVGAELYERLLAKTNDPQLRAYLACGWLAGMRRNEAYYLEWQQTDRAPWLDPGARRVWFPAGFVKAAEDQWVPLDPELWALLDALPRSGPRVFDFRDKHGRPVAARTMSSRVRRLARAAGVRLTYHGLRKGFGCRYAARVPAQVLQRLMRHSDISLTVNYYTNVDDAVEEAVFGESTASRNARARS